ncbi:MAG: ABC transporter ATP-binding protein [Clostridiales bacterium]|nr:ABC transporter ATP-binding protein [Clostridiales bacterium]
MQMDKILEVMGLKKQFKLSAKQQRLEKSGRKIVQAVDDLSFTANRGEIYGLLGPNGAGKTTTLRMLATLIKPDAGDALVDGVSIVNNPEKVRSRIGFLTSELKPEEYFTPSYLFDFFAELHGVSQDVRAARKAELFDTFGIGKFAEVKVANLSTGMKQKAAIAVTLAHDPDIIIFDEPTNGLDVLTAKVVTDYLLSLREKGKTVIVSTHIFSLIEKICDRVGVIIDGKMAVEGTLPEVCAGKLLEDRFFDIYAERAGEQA